MDEQLQQLLQAFLTTASGSIEDQQVIAKILKLIPHLPGVRKHNDPRIDYEEAFNLSLQGVWKGIRRFAENSSERILNKSAEINRRFFVAWFNRILMNKIYDMYRQQGNQPFSLDANMNDDNTFLDNLADNININTIDKLIEQENLKKNQEIENKIKSDLEKNLEQLNCHPRNCPECTCRELINRRLLKKPPERWQDIGEYFQIKWKAIESHWRRTCLPLLPQLGNI
ncbi:MAG: hypothetical protein RLZZ507_901 [Cyanobacteriota bacterium]|jgi:hypothetical protein